MPSPSEPIRTSSHPIAARLGRFRDAFDLPAAACAVFGAHEEAVTAVCGLRQAGGTAATIDDVWHYGSIGKSMTSLMIARLVEAGVLRWDMTVGEGLAAMPDVRASALQDVTLLDLLAHRAGLPVDPSRPGLVRYLLLGGNPGRTSARLLGNALRASRPQRDGDFQYSNLGYGLAGAIAVAATGEAYRTLMRRHVLDPLELRGAGFDRPPQDGTQPVEHRHALWGEKWVALKPGRRAVDDLDIVRPSGDVHGRIADLARYGAAHLRLLADPAAQAGGLGTLYRPVGCNPEPGVDWNYALGWCVERPSDGRLRLWHAGSTGSCFAYLALDPVDSCGFAFATNAFSPGWDEDFMARLRALWS